MAAAPTSPIRELLEPRARDVEGLPVARLLPQVRARSIGPYVFFDRMGPVQLAPGQGVDVGPHPHIGLATVTYLLEGTLVHRDSLGVEQRIEPGDVNWMRAGRGVVHSERSGDAERRHGARLHGLQLWAAHGVEEEDDEPSFQHVPGAELPRVVRGGSEVTLIAGRGFGVASPVEVGSLEQAFAVASLAAGEGLLLRVDDLHRERGVLAIDGEIDCASEGGTARLAAGRLAVLAEGVDVTLSAPAAGARVAILSGAPLAEPRHMRWNFVSSREDRILQAVARWREGRFPQVPGDDGEPLPMPD